MTRLHDAELSPMHLDDVPAGYPRSLERWVTVGGGASIFLRPVAPIDSDRMAHALEFGDSETIQRRFLTGAPPKGRGAVDYLVTLDYVWRLGLVAMNEEGNSIGIGRYEGEEGSPSAEIAIVIDPQWHQRGVGSVILEHIEAHARSVGINQFVAYYQPDNVGVAALLKALGYEAAPMVDSLTSVVKNLG